MIQVETSITIGRPLEVVLAVASDPVAGGSWQWGCATTARVATGLLDPAGQQSDARKESAGPRPVEKLAEAATCEAGAALAIQEPWGEVACEAAYHFDTVSSGTCVTWTGRITADGLYELIEAQIGQLMAMKAEISLRLLKYLLEWETHPHINATF